MGYDVKAMTKEARANIRSIEHLLYKYTFNEEPDVLPGYQSKYTDYISKIIVPELSLSYLDEDRDWVMPRFVDEERAMDIKYDFKPELVLYDYYPDYENYLFDFLYFNRVFSRMDFSFGNISKYAIFDKGAIDGIKANRVLSIDSENRQFRKTGNTVTKVAQMNDETFALLNVPIDHIVPPLTVKMDEDLFNLFVSRFGLSELGLLTRNFSSQSIVDNLMNEVGMEKLVKYMSHMIVMTPSGSKIERLESLSAT